MSGVGNQVGDVDLGFDSVAAAYVTFATELDARQPLLPALSHSKISGQATKGDYFGTFGF
jgi:hypothetical protein